ncbi:O-antigen ligase family protein [Luteococcus sp. H138]|uniref:O-antigen ligase family protein n=1 Tax=unclassified Luteococcus TaxID=2639923 RepID=UPI00313B6EAA
MFPAAAIVPLFALLGLWLTIETRPLMRGRLDAMQVGALTLLGWPTVLAVLRSQFSTLQATPMMLLGFLPGLIFGAVLGYRLLRERRVLNPGVVMVWLAVAFIVLHAALTHQSLVWGLMWMVSTLPALFCGWGTLESVRRAGAQSLLAVWLGMLLVMLVDPARNVSECRADKCSIFGKFLTPGGELNNELGMILAPLLPLALFGASRGKILRVSIPVVLMVNLSGSRSSLIMACLGVITSLLFTLPRRPRDWGFATLIVAVVGATLVPVLRTFPDDGFTWRGILWVRAKELIASHPWLGHGPSYWVRQTETNLFGPNYAPHNVWLEMMVTGGLFYTVLVVVGVGLAISRQSPRNRAAASALLIAVLSSGMTEAPIMPYRFAFPPGPFITLLLLTSLTPTTAVKRKESL